MTSSAVDGSDIAATAGVRVADVIRRAAQRRPGVVALRHDDRALTYAQLDERSNRLAQALLGSGIDRGARVAYLGRSAPEVIELLLAASKIGAVIVPLNWRLSPRRARRCARGLARAAADRGRRISPDGRGPPRGRIQTARAAGRRLRAP